jgi:small membrane protein
MNNVLSQIIIIGMLIAFAAYAFNRRSILVDRLLYILLAVTGIILVIHPDLSTSIAHLIGIGRGTDLIMYLFIIIGMFFAVNIISRLRKMEEQITALIGNEAIDHPVRVEKAEEELDPNGDDD